MKTKTVYHPSLPASKDVPVGDVQDWVDAGWRKTPLPSSTAAASAAGEASDNSKGKNA